ncbi:MAG: septum formation protein Maf [Bacteroidales bacterium]|nr:septum formation protein Maf [Bacteroidales bacterium]
MKIVLASKSPRRRELAARLGFEVRCVDVDVDEHTPAAMAASDVAEHLARRKAAAFDTARLQQDEVLVTADTVVALEGMALGKPAGRDEAVAMLRSLSGKTHTVYTGVCLRTAAAERSFTEATRVHFRHLDESTISHYVDTFHPADKAGAYGIQEWIGMVGISGIEGCYYNVMGLPTSRLFAELKSQEAALIPCQKQNAR